jgi:hypothetical protein
MINTVRSQSGIRFLRAQLGRRSRSLRRVVTPHQFKETYVNEALAGRPGATYLEVGVRDGESFRLAHADRRIGVDPARRPALATLRAGEEFFEMTSDRFFDEIAPQLLADVRIDVALIDGLHEFRQALRDLLAVERYMREDGVVVLDDCNPCSAERAAETGDGGAWNGDVWKVAEYVRRERPDLTFVTIDADQGVGIVTGFGTPADDPATETIERYRALPFDYLDRNRRAVLGLVAPAPLPAVLSGR